MAFPGDEIDSEEDYDEEREVAYVHDVLGAIARSRGVFLKSVKDVYKNIYGAKTSHFDICNVMEQNPEQTIKALCCSRSRATSRISRRTDFSYRQISNAVEELSQQQNDDGDAIAQNEILRPADIVEELPEECNSVEHVSVVDDADASVVSDYVVDSKVSRPIDIVEELPEICNADEKVQDGDDVDESSVFISGKEDILTSVNVESIIVPNEDLSSGSRSPLLQSSVDISEDSALPDPAIVDQSEYVAVNTVSTPEIIRYHGSPLKPNEEDPELFLLAENCNAPISRDLSTLEEGYRFAMLESPENFSPEEFFLVVPCEDFSERKISEEVSLWSTRFKTKASISNFDEISVGLPVLYGQCSSYKRGVITTIDRDSRTATVRLIDSGRLEHMVTISYLRRMSVAHSKWPGIAVRCSLDVATVDNKPTWEGVLEDVRIIAADWVRSTIIVPAYKDQKNRCLLDLYREDLGVYDPGSSLRKCLVRRGYAVAENLDDGLSDGSTSVQAISDEDNTTLSNCTGSITISIPSSPADSIVSSHLEENCKPEEERCVVTTHRKVVDDNSSGEMDIAASLSYQLSDARPTDVVLVHEKSIDDAASINSETSMVSEKKKGNAKSRFGFGKRFPAPSAITDTFPASSVIVENKEQSNHGDESQFSSWSSKKERLAADTAVKVPQKGPSVPSRFRLNN